CAGSRCWLSLLRRAFFRGRCRFLGWGLFSWGGSWGFFGLLCWFFTSGGCCFAAANYSQDGAHFDGFVFLDSDFLDGGGFGCGGVGADLVAGHFGLGFIRLSGIAYLF